MYAQLMVQRIVAAVERLRVFPDSGRMVPERLELREIIVPYQTDEQLTQHASGCLSLWRGWVLATQLRIVFRSGKLLVLAPSIILCLSAPIHAEVRPLSEGSRTRGLVAGWGHSWRPIFGQTRSQIAFVAFHPRMGWFVTDRLELYGEGTLYVYDQPQAAVAAGLGGLAGRYYLKTSGSWIPYVHAGAGLIWTSLDVLEIDRIFNFQLSPSSLMVFIIEDSSR